VRGEIVSGWRKDGESLRFTITIPPNTTARVILPCREPAHLTVHDGAVEAGDFAAARSGTVEAELGSGTYEISCPAR
jgi:alpha-L-rhamnosidase